MLKNIAPPKKYAKKKVAPPTTIFAPPPPLDHPPDYKQWTLPKCIMQQIEPVAQW